jgi:outer membrane immunogenic protein
VFGVEADVNYLGASSSFSVTTNSPSANTVTTANTRWDWYATLRGRLGVMLSPTMVYVTGGLAAAHVKDSFIATFPAFLAAGPTAIDRNLWGYAVGAGIEHLFTPDWSIKLEGMYIGLPTISTAARMSNNTYRSEFKHSLALIRLGINRKLRPN